MSERVDFYFVLQDGSSEGGPGATAQGGTPKPSQQASAAQESEIERSKEEARLPVIAERPRRHAAAWKQRQERLAAASKTMDRMGGGRRMRTRAHGMPGTGGLGRIAAGVFRGVAFAQSGTAFGLAAGASELGGAGMSALNALGMGGGISALAASAGGAAAAVAAFGLMVKAGSDALEGMAQRARSFSGEVALAFAERDVKRTLFEIEQAQKYGAIEARGVRARGDFGMEWDRLFDAAKAEVGKFSTDVTEWATKVLAGLNDLLGLRGKEQKFTEDMLAGAKLMRDAIGQLKEFLGADDANPAAGWMKNTPHFQLEELGFKGFDWQQQNALDFDPFRGALQP